MAGFNPTRACSPWALSRASHSDRPDRPGAGGWLSLRTSRQTARLLQAPAITRFRSEAVRRGGTVAWPNFSCIFAVTRIPISSTVFSGGAGYRIARYAARAPPGIGPPDLKTATPQIHKGARSKGDRHEW